MINAQYLKVKAKVRFWEDATVNGEKDMDGSLIPFRNGDIWEPVIDLEAGVLLDWPVGKTASIHYKVCDEGQYWLMDKNKTEIAQWRDYYVPDKFLCFDCDGFGDYIMMTINENGEIQKYRKPDVSASEWGML